MIKVLKRLDGVEKKMELIEKTTTEHTAAIRDLYNKVETNSKAMSKEDHETLKRLITDAEKTMIVRGIKPTPGAAKEAKLTDALQEMRNIRANNIVERDCKFIEGNGNAMMTCICSYI